MKINFSDIKNSILSVLFPPFGKCPSCGKVLLSEEFICEKCAGELQRPEFFCTVCGRVTEEGGVCVNCAENTPLWDRCVSSYTYTSPADTLVHEMKYRNYPQISDFLGKCLAEDINVQGLCENIDCITFVPSSEEKMSQRGYNQAELLARRIGTIQNIPVEGFLVDNGESVHQVGLSGTQRAENAQGRFSLREDACVAGKRMIIIDDVITTGATMNSCIKALKNGGAEYVVVGTVCQTVSRVAK